MLMGGLSMQGASGAAAPALGYLRAPNGTVLLKVDFRHREAHCKTKETECRP